MAQMIGNDFNRGQSPPPPKYKPPVAAPTAVDPMIELQKLLASLQSGGGGSADYYADASKIYQPQFSYLDQLGNEAKNNAAASGKQVSGLYGALQKDIRGQESGIRSNYDTGIKSVGAAYNDALNNVGQAYDNTRNNSAEILQRLGIEQAGSNVMGKSNQMEALIEGILGANNMATQNNLRQGKSSAVTFNTEQAGAAGLAGAEAQTGLKRQLADFMSQLMGKKADLQSQVNQTAVGFEQDAQKTAAQQAQDAYKQYMDQQRFGLDQDKFQYQIGHDKAVLDSKLTGSTEKLDPGGNLERLALNLYGNQQSAGNAVNAVMDALQQATVDGNGGKPSLGALLSVLEERLRKANGGGSDTYRPGDWGYLQRLAQQLYQ